MNHRKKYTSKELSFHKQFKNFRISKEESLITKKDGKEPISFWFITDKNGQIYDCARYGRSLDRLHGRPYTLINAYEIMWDEYLNSKEA